LSYQTTRRFTATSGVEDESFHNATDVDAVLPLFEETSYRRLFTLPID